MFNKKKDEMDELVNLYQAMYDNYMKNGVQFNPEETHAKGDLIAGKYGNILMVDFGVKHHRDCDELIHNYYFEGEVDVKGKRTYLSFNETDFISKNDVVYNGFMVDDEGVRIFPLNLSDKDSIAILTLKLDVFNAQREKEKALATEKKDDPTGLLF